MNVEAKDGTQRGRWKYLDDTLKNRLRKNSLTNILQFALTLPLIFILTPLILKYVGKEVYGIWVLTGTILIFLELIGGMQTPTALSIIVPRYNPKKMHAEINSTVNTMFVFYLFSALVFLGLYFLFDSALIKLFFNVEEKFIPLTRFVLGVSVVMFLFNFVLLGFGYLMGAFNIRYITNVIHIVIGYLRAGFMIAALYAGYGIKGIVVVQMSALILETFIILVFTKKIFPPLRFNPMLFSLKKLKALLGLSVKLIFSRAAYLINYHVDKLILGYFINPVMAAYYQIGASITKYISTLPEILGFSSLVPAASELQAKNQPEKIKVLYEKVNKYLFYPAVFLAAGILIFGKEFTFLWLGEGYGQVYTVMVFLCAAYTYGLIGYPAMNILNGLGKVNGPMIITSAAAVLNIALSIVLTIKYGLNGALAATAISIFAGNSAMYILFFIRVRYPLRLVNIFLKPLMAAAAAFFINGFIEGAGIIKEGWVYFLLKITVFALVYFILTVFVFKHFDDKDISLIKGALPGGKKNKT